MSDDWYKSPINYGPDTFAPYFGDIEERDEMREMEMSEPKWLEEKNDRYAQKHIFITPQIRYAWCNEPQFVHALEMAYRKHCLDDDSIGWDELGNLLADALSEAMGPTGFVKWLAEQTGDPGEGPEYLP